MTSTIVLSKKELLQWAASLTEVTPCAIYNDLRDGLVLLSLATCLFHPRLAFYEEHYTQQGGEPEEKEEEEEEDRTNSVSSGYYYDQDGRRRRSSSRKRGASQGSYFLHSHDNPSRNSQSGLSSLGGAFPRSRRKVSYIRVEKRKSIVRLSSLKNFLRQQRRGPRDEERCWSLFEELMTFFEVPLELLHLDAIRRGGNARRCYQILVCFYFMMKLSRDRYGAPRSKSHSGQFSIALSSPIDPPLAEFLESTACLNIIEYINRDSDAREKPRPTTLTAAPITRDKRPQGVADMNERRRVSPSPPSTAGTQSPPPPSDRFVEPIEYDDDDDDGDGEEVFHPPPPLAPRRTPHTAASHRSESRSASRSPLGDEEEPRGRASTVRRSISPIEAEREYTATTTTARKVAELQRQLDHLRSSSQVSLLGLNTKCATDLFRVKCTLEEKLRSTEASCQAQLQQQLSALLETLREASGSREGMQTAQTQALVKANALLQEENQQLREQLHEMSHHHERELASLGESLDEIVKVSALPFNGSRDSTHPIEGMVKSILSDLQSLTVDYQYSSLLKTVKAGIAALGSTSIAVLDPDHDTTTTATAAFTALDRNTVSREESYDREKMTKMFHSALEEKMQSPRPLSSMREPRYRGSEGVSFYNSELRDAVHTRHPETTALDFASTRLFHDNSEDIMASTAPLSTSALPSKASHYRRSSFPPSKPKGSSNSGSLLLLSPEELEERKNAILKKYGFS